MATDVSAGCPFSLEHQEEKLQNSSTQLCSKLENKEAVNALDPGAADKQHENITGIRLVIVLTSLTLVMFLMMLDTSIIVTVGLFPLQRLSASDMTDLGDPSNHRPISLAPGCGMVR